MFLQQLHTNNQNAKDLISEADVIPQKIEHFVNGVRDAIEWTSGPWLGSDCLSNRESYDRNMSLNDTNAKESQATSGLTLLELPNENIIIRIVHQRLLLAASLKDRKLILECYHPSAQYTEPYVFCDYLGTPGLSDEQEGQGSFFHDHRVAGGQLKHLYSRFRPSRADVSPRTVRPHPAGDVPGSRTSPTSECSNSKMQSGAADLVTHTVSLDPHELFTQFSVTAALVQIGPRRGVFLSFIDVIDKKTPRVWRDWLADKAKNPGDERREHQQDELDPIVWADQGRTLGLKVRVIERQWRKDAPILMHKDEDQAVSYSLDLEGERQSIHRTKIVRDQRFVALRCAKSKA
ncbi:hypothetical protein Q9189_006859 [Teloschistes chrysophthalmus]